MNEIFVKSLYESIVKENIELYKNLYETTKSENITDERYYLELYVTYIITL